MYVSLTLTLNGYLKRKKCIALATIVHLTTGNFHQKLFIQYLKVKLFITKERRVNASHQISKKEKNKSVYVEYAKVLDIKKFPAEQYIIRLHAPKSAKFSTPGSFIHLQCGSMLLRRPFSIMLSSKKEGWIDILYKVVGDGTKSLSSVKIGDSLSLMGPIGRGSVSYTHLTLPTILLV